MLDPILFGPVCVQLCPELLSDVYPPFGRYVWGTPSVRKILLLKIHKHLIYRIP